MHCLTVQYPGRRSASFCACLRIAIGVALAPAQLTAPNAPPPPSAGVSAPPPPLHLVAYPLASLLPGATVACPLSCAAHQARLARTPDFLVQAPQCCVLTRARGATDDGGQKARSA